MSRLCLTCENELPTVDNGVAHFVIVEERRIVDNGLQEWGTGHVEICNECFSKYKRRFAQRE